MLVWGATWQYCAAIRLNVHIECFFFFLLFFLRQFCADLNLMNLRWIALKTWGENVNDALYNNSRLHHLCSLAAAPPSGGAASVLASELQTGSTSSASVWFNGEHPSCVALPISGCSQVDIFVYGANLLFFPLSHNRFSLLHILSLPPLSPLTFPAAVQPTADERRGPRPLSMVRSFTMPSSQRPLSVASVTSISSDNSPSRPGSDG